MLTAKVILAFVFLALVSTQDYEYIDVEDYHVDQEPTDFLHDHQNDSIALPHQPQQTNFIWKQIYIILSDNYLIFAIGLMVALVLVIILVTMVIFLIRRSRSKTQRRPRVSRSRPVNRDSWFPYLTG